MKTPGLSIILVLLMLLPSAGWGADLRVAIGDLAGDARASGDRGDLLRYLRARRR